jgi:hypothetical protein
VFVDIVIEATRQGAAPLDPAFEINYYKIYDEGCQRRAVGVAFVRWLSVRNFQVFVREMDD